MRHTLSAAAPMTLQGWSGDPAGRNSHPAGAALLDAADILPDTRVVLIGPETLELLCALIRRGCASATAIQLFDRPRPASADLAILPAVASFECVDAGLVQARKALAPMGGVLLRFAGVPPAALVRHARRTLHLHGFEAVHSREAGHQRLLLAELPLIGRLAAA